MKENVHGVEIETACDLLKHVPMMVPDKFREEGFDTAVEYFGTASRFVVERTSHVGRKAKMQHSWLEERKVD